MLALAISLQAVFLKMLFLLYVWSVGIMICWTCIVMMPFENECSHEQQQLCTRHEASLVSVYFVLTLALSADQRKGINVMFVVKGVFPFKMFHMHLFSKEYFFSKCTKCVKLVCIIYLIINEVLKIIRNVI